MLGVAPMGMGRDRCKPTQYGLPLQNTGMGKMRKYWALGAAMAASLMCTAVRAQSIPDEYNRKIAGSSGIGTLVDDFAGDRVDLGSGSLEIVRTDIDLPGNNALPVRIGRYFQPAYINFGGHFGIWRMDLPSVHGTFADVIMGGWRVESQNGGYNSDRCSSFGRPPDGFSRMPTKSDVIWGADDYWHGTFFHLPGSGDQELLGFWAAGHAPSDGHAYHAMTRAGAVARCVALAPTSDASVEGEGFEIVSPDGTVYTLNQMAKRYIPALGKGAEALPRADFFLFPTQVADRFGNTVTYTWSATNPWQLTRIAASDGRHLDLTYESSDSMRVSTVTDGSRTWHYAYASATDFSDTATDTLTLPDGGIWRFRLAALSRMTTSAGTVHCGDINGITQRTTYDDGSGRTPTSGSITAPSGATVSFAMSKILFGRSHVAFNCGTEVADADPSQARPEDPYLFYGAAVVGKTITGPGLPSAGLHWGYSYGPSNNCWDGTYIEGIACTPSSPDRRTVLVVDPTGATTRYTFGNRANVDEGMLFRTEHGWNGTSALRTVDIAYGAASVAPYGAFDGWSLRGTGDPALTSRNQPQRKVTTTQQGVQFTWEVATGCNGMPYCFDAYARPTRVLRSGVNTPAATQAESILYDDDTVHWVLGQVAQRTVDGLPVARTVFDADHLPWKVYAFGELQNTFGYDKASTPASGQLGTLKTVADGKGNTTTYTSWKRGIPQAVAFADGRSRSAVVSDQGWITSVTDENGFATAYAYDPMGRITQVTYPAGDSVAWAPTTSVFEPVASAEYGVPGGHWRQTVNTGNARKVTLFDALWRPVLVREYDAANIAGTDRYSATAYDNGGRVADASYPTSTAPTMAAGTGTWLLGAARPNGVRTAYDALGRPTTVQQDSELGVLTTTTQYLAGLQRRVTDARGHATTETFMAWDTPTFDWPVRIDAPESQFTLIGRDTFGKPATITRQGVAP